MSRDPDLPARSDHLKYYCVIFMVLVVVIGVVALKQRSTLEKYQLASARARGLLNATGRTSRGRPRGVGELAVEVEKFVKGYRESIGGDDVESGGGISIKRMEKAERSVNMKYTYGGPDRKDPHPNKGYITRSREFTYGPCNLNQFTRLIYNIEGMGQYRVFEFSWKLAEKKENSAPPHNRITKPRITVGTRLPYTRDDR